MSPRHAASSIGRFLAGALALTGSAAADPLLSKAGTAAAGATGITLGGSAAAGILIVLAAFAGGAALRRTAKERAHDKETAEIRAWLEQLVKQHGSLAKALAGLPDGEPLPHGVACDRIRAMREVFAGGIEGIEERLAKHADLAEHVQKSMATLEANDEQFRIALSGLIDLAIEQKRFTREQFESLRDRLDRLLDLASETRVVTGETLNRVRNMEALMSAGAAAAAPNARFSLPEPPRDFTGRQTEFDDLQARISRGATIFSVRGMGGIGKTALALFVAHALKDDYPDAQLLLDLKGTATGNDKPLIPIEAMAYVIRAFQPEIELPEEDREIAALYRGVLNGKRALLIFDNARDRAQVETLVPPGGALMLVTSRVKFTLPGLSTLDLDVMEPGDAIDFLHALCLRIGDRAAALAELCGRLPLALRLAGSALAERPVLSVDRYMERLRDEAQRLSHLDHYETAEDRKVAASIALSEAMLSETLRDRWRMLAVFPGGFDRPAAAAVWDLPLDGPEAEDALSELHRLSLVDWDNAADRYRLHDLVRAFARGRAGAALLDAAARRHAAHFRAVLARADDLYRKGGEEATFDGLRLFDAERGNIEAGFAWAREHAKADEQAARLCMEYPDVGVRVLAIRLPTLERIAWLTAQLEAAEKLGDQDAAAAAYANFGLVLQTRGDLAGAEAMHRKSLAINEQLGSLKGMATAYGNLGVVLKTRGDLAGAEAMYRKSLAIEEKLGRLEGMANNYGNLGNVLFTRGDLDGAKEMYQKSLEISDPNGMLELSANQYGNLGNVLFTRGDLNGAEAMYRKALAIDEKLGRLEGMASDYGSLGIVLKIRRDLDGAQEMYGKALAIHEQLGSLEGMASDYGNLGNVLFTRGDLDGAEGMHRKSLAIEEKLGRLEGMANAYANLGIVRRTRGDFDGARANWVKSRDLYARLGAPHMVEKVQGWIDGLPPAG